MKDTELNRALRKEIKAETEELKSLCRILAQVVRARDAGMSI